jgi:streptogramin lyase
MAAVMTVGEGAVWVSTARGAVARIDPRTNEVAQVIELTPALTDDVAAGAGAVWVAEIPGVKRIDPAAGEVRASIDLGVNPVAVQAVDGSVWVAGERVRWAGPDAGYESLGDRVVLRVDPHSGRVQREIHLPAASRVAVGHGVVWVSQDDGTLTAIDPSLGEPIGRPLPECRRDPRTERTRCMGGGERASLEGCAVPDGSMQRARSPLRADAHTRGGGLSEASERVGQLRRR